MRLYRTVSMPSGQLKCHNKWYKSSPRTPPDGRCDFKEIWQDIWIKMQTWNMKHFWSFTILWFGPNDFGWTLGPNAMYTLYLYFQNSLVGPFFPYQDRHWKTARHEKIEASELKPSEEKKSIMVWSLSNLTTEIRPGKHLENPTKLGQTPIEIFEI